jgi:hypothetical protein
MLSRTSVTTRLSIAEPSCVGDEHDPRVLQVMMLGCRPRHAVIPQWRRTKNRFDEDLPAKILQPRHQDRFTIMIALAAVSKRSIKSSYVPHI